MKEFRLEGKTALVTGGGRGIGKVLALVLAEAGADVAVAARTYSEVQAVASDIEALGRRSVAIQADITDSQQAEEMVSKATEYLGRVDVLVNNAGATIGASSVVSLENLSEADSKRVDNRGMGDDSWDLILQTNLSSVFFCCRAVAPQMLKRRSGKVINVSSVTGIYAEPYYTAYDSSKAGLNMLTKCLALEWGPYNINVNGIGPGWFITEMTRSRFQDPEIYKDRVKNIPLGRLTDIRDLGLLAVYLASPASDWMTGQVIYLDGGQSAIHL